MSPHTATTPLRQLSLQRVSATQKSRSFISPNNSNYAQENEVQQSPIINQNVVVPQLYNQRDASIGTSNTGAHKLLFMKSEESVPAQGWPNILNQKQSTISSSKMVHFQSSPGQHKSTQQVKPFKKKDLKELLIGPSHLKQIHNGPMAPQKQYLQTDGSEDDKNGLTNSMQRPKIVPKLKLNDLMLTQNSTMKNSPNSRPMNNTLNKLQIGNLMQSQTNENASLYRPTQHAAVTERDETMRIKELNSSGQNGLMLQGSTMNWSKHLHGPRIDNNLNQYRRNMLEKEGEISQTSSFGRSSRSDITAQSNRTQEKDFTPGQHQQFKSFLKSQTVDRDDGTEDKLMNSLLGSQATVAQENGTNGSTFKLSEPAIQLKKNLNMQIQNKSQKQRIRAQTRQVQSKQDDDLAELKGGGAEGEVAVSVMPLNKKEQKRRQNVRHIKQNSHMNISNRMSPTPQPIPIEIFSHTESDGNNSSHRYDNNDFAQHLQSNQRLKYRGGQKKFIMSKFSLNHPSSVAEKQRDMKIAIVNNKDPRSFKKRQQAIPGVHSDSMNSINDSNANYDSSPQLTEQKSVRQMLLHTHEKERTYGSEDDQIIDYIDEEGHRIDPIGNNLFGHRQTQPLDEQTDSANLSNLNASVNEMEANEFHIDENTQNLSGIFQQLAKNKIQPNRTLMQGHMMPKSIVDDRVDSNQKSQGGGLDHHQMVSPMNGNNASATGFDFSEFGKLIMSQLNPFSLPNQGHGPSESMISQEISDNAGLAAQHLQHQYQIQDYQTTASNQFQQRQTAPPTHQNSEEASKRLMIPVAESFNKKKPRSRYGNESLQKRKSYLNVDDSMEMNEEENQKMKHMMLDTERRKVLQKKGVSHKNPVASHKDLEKKPKRHKEVIKTDDGPSNNKGRTGKKGNLQIRKTDYDVSASANQNKNEIKPYMAKQMKNYDNQNNRRPKAYDDVNMGEYMENRVGDAIEPGLSGEHREELQMQIKQQFSARKQYFNGNGPLPAFIDKQASADQDDRLAVSVEVKAIQKSLKNQSLKSGAKSQSSLNEEDRGKSLKTQFMNMFAFGAYQQDKRASKKEIDIRKSQDLMKKSKNSSKNLKSSFLGTNKDDLQQPSKIASSKQERGHKTLSLQTGIVDNQKSSKCYSPKFHKPQLVKPPSQNNTSKESTNRVTPINLSQKSKFNLFHPRTTKNTDLTNREENVVGEIANVKVFGGAMVGLRGDLASVRSSQMLVLRSNQKANASEKKSDMKNISNATVVKSARGHTEERRGNLILNELSKNKKMNTISGQSNSESPEEDALSTREKSRQKQLHYRGLNKPMSTMMIMRNNLTNETKHQKKTSGKNPKHFVFPTPQAQLPNTNQSSTINRTMNTMNTQILSMMDNKSQKKSGRQHQQHQSFLSQQHENNQEGSIIESARQHKAHENGSSANQPIIAHYQRHSFVEDQIAEQFDETNAYAFEMQQNESTSLSPIKNKNKEPFVDEVQTMVKKSKKKVANALNQQKSAPRNEYSRTEGLSQCSINTNSWQLPQPSSSSNPLLPPLKSKSFNQHLAPSQPLPFPSHHLQSSHLSSIISHNIQSQHSNGQHVGQGSTSQVSGANLRSNVEKRSNSLSSERRLLHRDVEKQQQVGPTGQQVKLATFTQVANALQQFQQNSSDRPIEKAKEGNQSDQISRNPTSSMMIEMQETIPLDRIHQDKTDITIDNPDDDADLQEATIWNAGNKIQAGAWSKVSQQAQKNQSLLGAQRSAIGPKGTNIALSEAVRKHNRQTSKTTLDHDVKSATGKDKMPRTTLKRKENESSSQSKKMARQQQIMLQDEQLRIEENNALKTLPVNGCNCNGEIGKQQKRGCVNAERWLKLSFKDQEWVHFNNYKLYQMHLKSQQMIKDDGNMNIDNQMNPSDTEQDIKLDVERTFQHLEYFQRAEIKDSMTRILVTYSNYEASIGYVQGMNFVVAILLYHAGEVGAYFLLDQLMEKYQLKQVMQTGLPGLRAHEKKIEEIGREELPALFEHFDKHDVTISLFSTDWIMSMFLNFVPIEMSHIYLSLFFEKGWDIFYYVAIQILKYYNDKLLKLNDAGYIVGQIKQARVGCEHLLMLSSSQHSIQSSSKLLSQSFHDFSLRESVPISSHMKKDQYKLRILHEDTERQSKDHSEMSMPFGVTSPQVPEEFHPSAKPAARLKGVAPMVFSEDQIDVDDEPFEKEAISILDDSRSEIMTEHQNQSQLHHNQSSRHGQGPAHQNRSQSLMPQPKNISPNDEPILPNLEVKLGQNMQMSSGYRRNPMMKKNTKMWKQIIREVQKKFQTEPMEQQLKDGEISQLPQQQNTTAGANNSTATPTISVHQ